MSSSDIAVSVRGLSKSYTISHDEEKHNTLAEKMLSRLKSPMRRPKTETFWALKDIEFDIQKGDVVGIIGRNGAGKSTLLKILSRITEPTSGKIDLYGRVGSLLEVGTGFHPELTGRENIYLNGAILGMSKGEIRKQFDAIVDFAGVEKFLDTPVKRYSSGMYVRLAFAVAAHLRSGILILDEVLAVGDQRFQEKCLGKINDVARDGRTVLFVSHGMQTVSRLCNKCLMLENGLLKCMGLTREVQSKYLFDRSASASSFREWRPGKGDDVAKLLRVNVAGTGAPSDEGIDISDPIEFRMEFEVLKSGYALIPNFNIRSETGVCIFAAIDTDPQWHRKVRPVGRHESIAKIPAHLLIEGLYFGSLALSTFNPLVHHALEVDAVAFSIVDQGREPNARGDYAAEMPGVIRPLLQWKNLAFAELR